jgi:hypothetical protein
VRFHQKGIVDSGRDQVVVNYLILRNASFRHSPREIVGMASVLKGQQKGELQIKTVLRASAKARVWFFRSLIST